MWKHKVVGKITGVPRHAPPRRIATALPRVPGCGPRVNTYGSSSRGPQAARFREQQAGQLEQLPLAGQEQHQESVETKLEQHVEHAAAKVAHSMSGFLSDPDTEARAYWLLGCVTAATSAECLLAPAATGGVLLRGATDAVVDAQIRVAGATLLTSTVVALTLKEAAVRQQLYMATFRRLNIGLVLQSLGSLVLTAQAVSLRNPVLTGYATLVCGSGLLLSARMYALTKPPGSGLPLPSPTRTLSAAVGVLMPRNAHAAAYSALTLACAWLAWSAGGAAPGAPMRLYEGLHGPMTVFAQRAAGAGLVMMALVAYSLKDGADRQRLGATTFRWLNLGLASSLLAMAWSYTRDYATGLLLHTGESGGMLAGIIAAFCWTAYAYATGTSAAAKAQAA